MHYKVGEDSACSTTDTNSICKSSLLFSPVKETPVLPPGGSYSVDSLDCEDMLLTCQANNKNNYTIAFEGSMTMYSDSSQDFESHEKQKTYKNREVYYNKKIDIKNIQDYSMACSDSKIYTTWSNLKHSSTNNKTMTRHGSGNNNTIPNFLQPPLTMMLNPTKKSLSLPDLTKTTEQLENLTIPLNFSIDSAESHHQHLQNSGSALIITRSVNESANSNILNQKKLQNMSLVKLFMKQKSMSAEGMSLTLDQSDSASDNGWPISNSASESGTTNTNTQIQRQNINETSKEQLTDNDFTINWVKTDCNNYNKNIIDNSTSDICTNNIASNRTPSIKEFKDESPSVEELSESILKSDINNDKSNKNIKSKLSNQDINLISISKTTAGTQAMTQVEENGVQTSLIYSLSSKNNFPLMHETFINKKPIYIIYPNYTLPDLSFLNANNDKQFDNIALKPHERIGWKKSGRNNKNFNNSRPFSCNDIDALKQRGFSHVTDWESLTFLLPNECKKILHDVPEVSKHIKLNEEIKKPLFCLSPPPLQQRQRQRGINEILPTNVSSSSSTGTQPSSGYRGSSTILTDSSTNQQNPLYLYRYDSSENSLITTNEKKYLSRNGIINIQAKRSLSLPHGDKDINDVNIGGKVPPRPPLPRSILRKNRAAANKRYSMFEMGACADENCLEKYKQFNKKSSGELKNKRMSLQEPYYINNDLQLLRHGRIIDSDKDVDEVEERGYVERMREVGYVGLNDIVDLESSGDDVKQLDEFFKRSGLSSNSSDDSCEDSEVRLRSYVRKFLSLKMNKDIKAVDMLDSQKKTVSFAQINQRQLCLNDKLQRGIDNDDENKIDTSDKLINFDEKKTMIIAVDKSVDLLIKYWNTIQHSSEFNDKNECPQICLSNLCPAIYAIMSDGLKPHLNSTFGPISNSVWQIVEASSQQGPLTNTLNELVQKINSEDFITEGLIKFNAFVFGLLNLRALDAWFAYLCTRETILRKHYSGNSLFVAALGCANSRQIIDNFLTILQPLALLPFQLDLLYQYRQLHNSFGYVNNNLRVGNVDGIKVFDKNHSIASVGSVASPKKIRPRSCGNYDEQNGGGDEINGGKKRWSNIGIGGKLYSGLDKFIGDDSEEYTDSLEHSPLNRAGVRKNNFIGKTSTPIIGAKGQINNDDNDVDDGHNYIPGELKFRKLQEKWELMVNKVEVREQTPMGISPTSPNQLPNGVAKSKIPRLLTSPIRQCGGGIVGKNIKSPVTGIPSLKKPMAAVGVNKFVAKKSPVDFKVKDVLSSRRTSRVDQDNVVTIPRSHLTRPSSLPYKSHGINAKEKTLISPQRRAASTSLPRPNTPGTSKANTQLKRPMKEVRTTSHRLPADNGHLSFNEGDRLKVIFEVDNKWLLCAKGDKRGLVPRACVHPCQT
ncbi:hypothetical protein PV325_004085 [Microctonus aethiopoides]|nr:hypothetical protein PV325_004085 [Microctonus aethiopoides]